MRMWGFLCALSLILLPCCMGGDAPGQGGSDRSEPSTDKALLVADADEASWAQAHVSFSAPDDVVEVSCDWLWLSGCGAVEFLRDSDGDLQTVLSASVCDIDGEIRLMAMSGSSVWLCGRVEDDEWHSLALSLDLNGQSFTATLDDSTTPCAGLPSEAEGELARQTLYLRFTSYPSLGSEFMVDDIVIADADGAIFEELWDESEAGSPPESPWGTYAEGDASATVELIEPR